MNPPDTTTPLAVITGATGGIGIELARGLARRGYATWLIGRRVDRLQRLADELSTLAPSLPIALDLRDASAIGDTLGPLLNAAATPPAVLINNAGVGQYRRFLDCTAQEHDDLLQVNYHAPAALIRLMLPAMLAHRRGHIINIASIASVMGPWGHSGYAAAKAALVTLTESLAADYADTPVHFSYVNPGLVNTPFFKGERYQAMFDRNRNRSIPPGAAAATVLSLLDKPRLSLTIPRHFRLMSVLAAISPRLAHAVAARQSRPTPAPAADVAATPQVEPSRPGG